MKSEIYEAKDPAASLYQFRKGKRINLSAKCQLTVETVKHGIKYLPRHYQLDEFQVIIKYLF